MSVKCIDVYEIGVNTAIFQRGFVEYMHNWRESFWLHLKKIKI